MLHIISFFNIFCISRYVNFFLLLIIILFYFINILYSCFITKNALIINFSILLIFITLFFILNINQDILIFLLFIISNLLFFFIFFISCIYIMFFVSLFLFFFIFLLISSNYSESFFSPWLNSELRYNYLYYPESIWWNVSPQTTNMSYDLRGDPLIF